MIKKLINLTLFLCILPLQAHTPLRAPVSLHRHNQALEKLLVRGYGIDNPFLELVTVTDLVAELQSTPLADEHSAALHLFSTQMEYAIAECITAFAQDKMRSPALKTLTSLANQASAYISQHLSPQAAQAQTTRIAHRKQKRVVGALIGASIFSSTIKYIIIGVVGASILGLGWSIYHSWTAPITEKTKEIVHTQAELTGAICAFKEAMEEYKDNCWHETLTAAPAQVPRGIFKRIVARVGNKMSDIIKAVKNLFKSKQKISIAQRRSIAASLEECLNTMQKHPQAFGLKTRDYKSLSRWNGIIKRWADETTTR